MLPTRHRYGGFVYQEPPTATGCVQLPVLTFKVTMIPNIHYFCGTFQDPKLESLHITSPETTVYLPVPVVFPNATNRVVNN
jgi:hypothetical protein